MPYPFDQIFAADPDNTEMVASNVGVLIFAPGDETKTPLPLTTLTGIPLANPVPVNDKGFGPAFMADLDQVAWEGGGFTGLFASYKGMKDEAVAARQAAEAARAAAEEAARNTVAPTSEAIATALGAEGPARDAVNTAVIERTTELALKPDNGARAIGKGELILNVKDFSTLQEAVTAAEGKTLYWPNGEYAVTGNLAGFWKADHTGFGVLTRGAQKFHITPIHTPAQIQQNTIWVSGSGSDSNDGLFQETPIASLSNLDINILTRLGNKVVRGSWRVRISGTVRGGRRFNIIPSSGQPIIFEGDDLFDGKPTSTIEYANVSGAGQKGLWFEPGSVVHVKRMKFTNFTFASGTGYGLIMANGGQLTYDDCLADNCDTGFGMINNVTFSANRSVATNCKSAGHRAQYSTSGGWVNCEGIACEDGFFVSRNAVTHVDFCKAESNTNAGVHIDMNSRAHVMGTHFLRNTVGVDMEGGAEWVNNTSDVNYFYHGTPDANGTPYTHTGNSRETRLHSQSALNEFMVGRKYSTASLTGSTTNTLLYSGNDLGVIPNLFMVGNGKRIRIRIMGNSTGTAGNKQVFFYVPPSTGGSGYAYATWTIPAAQGGAAFELEATIVTTGPSKQTTFINGTVNGGTQIVGSSESTQDMSGERLIRVAGQLGSSADTLRLTGVEVYVAG